VMTTGLPYDYQAGPVYDAPLHEVARPGMNLTLGLMTVFATPVEEKREHSHYCHRNIRKATTNEIRPQASMIPI
jgi:hypothetical protein